MEIPLSVLNFLFLFNTGSVQNVHIIEGCLYDKLAFWYTRMFKLKHKMLSIKTKQTQISEPNIGSSCERRCARTSVTERLRTITKKFWGRGIFYSWIIRLIWCIKVVRWRTCSKIVIYRSMLLSYRKGEKGRFSEQKGWPEITLGQEPLSIVDSTSTGSSIKRLPKTKNLPLNWK